MAPRKTTDKVDDNDESLLLIQGEVMELKERLKRVDAQRTQSDKENEHLRAEIRRMKEALDKQVQSRTGATGKGVTKKDANAQTEDFVNLDCGKNMTHRERDQTRHIDVFIDKNTQNAANSSRFDDQNNFENYSGNNRREDCCGNVNQLSGQDNLMKGLMNYFDALQVSISLPKFDGVKKNPIEFIKDIEKYFVRKNISEHLKLILVEDALTGKAKMWHDTRAFPFITFKHFKDKFLEEFYSIDVRMNAKYEWENRRFQVNDGSLQAYYTEQLRVAKFCLSSLAEYEINYLIVKQLPQRAREVLATIDYSDTSKILQALARLDVTRRDVENGVPSNAKDNNVGPNFNNYNKVQSGSDNQKDHNNANKKDSYGNSQYRPRNNDGERFRNWRQGGGPSGQSSREQGNENVHRKQNTRDTSRDEGNQGNKVNAIVKSSMSEFVEDLCWDVEPEKETVLSEIESKIVSPRIRAVIEGHEVAVLVDSGSEVTALSEKFYNELKNKFKLIKLPVSNLTVSVAVGNKNTSIKRQVQLTLKIGERNLTSPFLVVPGLATDVLVGIDWLSRFKCVIDIENQRIRMGGEELSDSIVTFRMTRDKKVACRLLQTNDFLLYDSKIEWYRLGEENKSFCENKSSLGDSSHHGGEMGNDLDNEQYVRQISSNAGSFAQEVDEYVANLKSLNKNCREQIRDLLLKYEAVFSTEPGCTNVYEHTITLTKAKTIV